MGLKWSQNRVSEVGRTQSSQEAPPRPAMVTQGHFGGKALHVVLSFLQQALRDKQRHGHVFVAGRL